MRRCAPVATVHARRRVALVTAMRCNKSRSVAALQQPLQRGATAAAALRHSLALLLQPARARAARAEARGGEDDPAVPDRPVAGPAAVGRHPVRGCREYSRVPRAALEGCGVTPSPELRRVPPYGPCSSVGYPGAPASTPLALPGVRPSAVRARCSNFRKMVRVIKRSLAGNLAWTRARRSILARQARHWPYWHWPDWHWPGNGTGLTLAWHWHWPGTGPALALARHWPGTGPALAGHWPGTGPALVRQWSGNGTGPALALARHSPGTGPAMALARHWPGAGPTGTGPALARHWLGTGMALARHWPGTGPALARHWPGTGPAHGADHTP
jgi:hypothetical protein